MRHLAVLLTIVIVTAGCGGGQDPADRPAAGHPADSERHGDPVTVRVRVSGGITGVDRTYVLDTAAPPRRMSDAAAHRIAELASSEAVRGYAGTHVDRGDCCDLLEYTVVIEHPDGAVTRIVTNDADRPPREYTRLLALLTRDGAERLPASP